ncbi:MAG: hypothetical protein ACI4F0_01125 [Agathobacter sp.]
MGEELDFASALKGKKVPILTLDQKWHRLFAIHGKPEEVKGLESELNELLKRQGKLNNDLKDLKKKKNLLMDNIVQNMEGSTEEASNSSKARKLEEDRQKIDEINALTESYEDELLELPNKIKATNELLMIKSMDYFYGIIRVNKEESEEIDRWITQVRIDLKKNIIRKQNRDINNKEMYAYLHDVLGPEVIDMFDRRYEESKGDT